MNKIDMPYEPALYDDEKAYSLTDLEINSDGWLTIDTGYTGTTSNGDDSRTMTEQEYQDNQEKIKQNENNPIVNAIDTVLIGTRDVLQGIQTPIDKIKNSVKDAVSNVLDTLSISFKTAFYVVATIGICFLIKMSVDTKKNIKILKGKSKK
ncbi:MAG: hypothetical protein LBD41_03460 [Clostridiales Family XIII bacterium]|jgi:hypothetical protein|nr:hypothetical protein [Clostridiales Family XIII bacterium]